MNKYLAQEIKIGNSTMKGPLPDDISTVTDIINIITRFLFPLAGVILFVILVIGGYTFMISRGDAEKVKKAKAIFTSSIVGFILLVLSYFMVRVIAFIFGIGNGII